MMNIKDYKRTKEFVFSAKTALELQYVLGYEDALNTFGLTTRKQHYELHDNIHGKILKMKKVI